MYFLAKVIITAVIVAGISELARRYNLVAAALASLPLTSILALVWLYHDTHDLEKISALSYSILWLVLPSLLFFVLLPQLLAHGLKFYPALLASCALMSAGYGLFIVVKRLVA